MATTRRQTSGAASPVAFTTPALAIWMSTRSEGSKSARRRPVALAQSMSSTTASYASLRRFSKDLAVGKVLMSTSAKPQSTAYIAQTASI